MDEKLAPPNLSALTSACSELGCIADGFDGFLAMIADNKSKELRIKRDALFYAINPLYERMRVALDVLNESRKIMREAR